jgi:hypothetical protein
MPFDLARSLELLERTPGVLEALLGGLPADWTYQNEGPDTWSPYDVLGHLIHGERTDWMARMDIILRDVRHDGDDKRFVPFDRFAQFRESEGKSVGDLLREFREVRLANVAHVRRLKLDDRALDKTGIHPVFGEVTLRQLLSTWTVHDLDHLMQISRVMAKQLKADVGPWVAFLRIVRD